MNEAVKKIADAVLYEGFIVYPYRASAVKNRQRFNFGVFVPRSFAEAQNNTEHWRMQTEVLIYSDDWKVDLKLRFLQIREREVYRYDELSNDFIAVEKLETGDRVLQSWQESIEREIDLSVKPFKENDVFDFALKPDEDAETIATADGKTLGKLVRKIHGIEAGIHVSCEELAFEKTENLFKMTVGVENTTKFEDAEKRTRNEALAQSLISAHLILTVTKGEFVSLLEPPDDYAEAAANCQNIATFPVLVGQKGERDCMLSSPIILYDYPEIAAESAGDLFDGSEIDELLTLRILTMTNNEKAEMIDLDDTARAFLERTESLSNKQLERMHGAFRETE